MKTQTRTATGRGTPIPVWSTARTAFLLGAVVMLGGTGTATAEQYAVLFAGVPDADETPTLFHDAADHARGALINHLNFLPENILVLSDDGSHLLDGNPVDAASAANLQALLGGLDLAGGDTFVFWAYSHGSGDKGEPTVYGEESMRGYGDRLYDHDLAAWAAPIEAGRQVYMFGSCYSGGMLDDLNITGGDGRFGCASANHYELCYYDESLTPIDFMDALRIGMATNTQTHDFYTYALNNTHWATDGEGPGGTQVDGVQHPWKVGDDYDLRTRDWMGWQNGSWTDPDNWSEYITPTTDHAVRIRMDGTPHHPATISSGGHTVWSLSVGDVGELHVTTGAVLNVTTGFDNNGGTVHVTNAHMDVDGEIENNDGAAHLGIGNAALVYGDSLYNEGEVAVAGGSLLHVYGPADNDGTLHIHSNALVIIDDDLVNRRLATTTVEDSTSGLQIGRDYLAHGTTDVRDGAALQVGNTFELGARAKPGGAQLHVTDASVTVGNQVLVGTLDNGIIDASSSTIDVGSLLSVGQTDRGLLYVRGSTVTATYLFVGDGAEGDSQMSVNGPDVPYIKMGGTSPKVVVGRQSTGTVTQNAGWLTRIDPDGENPKPPFPELVVGDDAEGIGVYNFNHGEVRVSNMTVGNLGNGKFIQRGGAADAAGQVTLAAGSAAIGQYDLDEGSLACDVLEVARHGDGQFTQTSGLVMATTLLRVATDVSAKGTVDLNGGTLQTACVYGGAGPSYLNIDGGTLDLTGAGIDGIRELNIATETGDVGMLNLVNKDVATMFFYIGKQGQGTCHMTGGTITTISPLVVGSNGTGEMDQTGGTVTTDWLYVGFNPGSSGTYTLDGDVTVQQTEVGYNGTGDFIHNGGIHAITDNLRLGAIDGQGTYTFNGGKLIGGGDVILGSSTHAGTGTLTLNGTTLSGPVGRLAVSAPGSSVKGYGTICKRVVNDGSVIAANGTLTLEHAYLGSGDVTIQNAAALELQANATLAGPVTNDGTLRVTGGTTQLLGGVSGGTPGDVEVGAAGQIDVASDVDIANMSVEGLVRQFSGQTNLSNLLNIGGQYVLGGPAGLTGSTVDVAGAFQHEGTHTCDGLFVSSPSSMASYTVSGGTLTTGKLVLGADAGGTGGSGEFNITNPTAFVEVTGKLEVHAGGAIHAAPGATIHLTGSAFDNRSTDAAALADLRNLELVFEGGPVVLDPFEVAGADHGPVVTGFDGNFTLGTLCLGETTANSVGRIQFVDKHDNQPASRTLEALYVKHVALGPDAYLDLQGMALFCQTSDINPTASIVGGSIQHVAMAATDGVPQGMQVTTTFDPTGTTGLGLGGLNGAPLLPGTVSMVPVEVDAAVAASDNDFITPHMYYLDDDLADLGIDELDLKPVWWDGSEWVVGGTTPLGTIGPGVFAGVNVNADDYGVGYFGVNTTDNFVWNHVTHASTYGLSTIPEPSAFTLAVLGVLGFAFCVCWRKR